MSNPIEYLNAVLSVTDKLGIVPAGTIREDDRIYAVFNAWELRDAVSRQLGTYEDGRFSFKASFGGRWFCCLKYSGKTQKTPAKTQKTCWQCYLQSTGEYAGRDVEIWWGHREVDAKWACNRWCEKCKKDPKGCFAWQG
jgi:hypothetical protein